MPDTRPTFAEVLLHAAISIITGVIVALVVLSVTSSVFLAGYGIDYKSYTFGAGTTAALVTWYYLLANYVFPRLRVDKPKPQQPAVTRIEHVSPDKKQLRYEDCPATMEQLEAVAVKVFDYGGITSAAGEQIFGGRIPYENFRDWMMTPIQREYFQWVNTLNHKQGVEVTEAGYEWLADYYPPPPEAVAYRIEDDLGVTHTRTEEE
jgi:hypothetical protein